MNDLSALAFQDEKSSILESSPLRASPSESTGFRCLGSSSRVALLLVEARLIFYCSRSARQSARRTIEFLWRVLRKQQQVAD